MGEANWKEHGNEMENGFLYALGFRVMMENELEEKMENEMGTGALERSYSEVQVYFELLYSDDSANC